MQLFLKTTELHVFADVSNQVYRVVSYTRDIINGDVQVSFVMGKRKLTSIAIYKYF